MKLKSLIIIAICCFTFTQKSNAQSGQFDLHLNLGYGFPIASQYFYNNTGAEVTLVPYSLGSGGNIDLGAGYMFGDHIGAGLDITDMMGTPFKYTEIAGNLTIDHSYSGMLLAVTPMLILSANTGQINPYGHFGIVLGAASYTHSMTETGKNASEGTFVDTYSGGSAIGIYTSFGLQFGLSQNLKLNLEVFDRTMAYAPGKVENTEAFTGEQKLTTVTYVDKVDSQTPNDQELKFYEPFSSIGLKVGIVLVLAGQK
jgi:hypothetical protein